MTRASVLIFITITAAICSVVSLADASSQRNSAIEGTTGPETFALALCTVSAVSLLVGGRKKIAIERDQLIQSLATASSPATSSGPMLRPLAIAVKGQIDSLAERSTRAETRQRELEIELRVMNLERAQMRSIIQSISDGVLVTDAWDELVLANPSAVEILGIRDFDQRRQPIEKVVADAKLVSLIREMRATRTTSSRRVVEHHMNQSGRDRTFKVTLSSLGNESSGVLVLMHDMTHEAEVARMKNDFVSHVSHELRTPLASIKAYIEMLIDGETRDARQTDEFYDVIQNEANRLGRLIDNILDVSRIEAGVVKANKHPLSLTVVLNEALEVIAPQASAKQITIRQNVEPAMVQVMADKDMIYRAMLNLLSNAIKYTPEGGTVTASTAIDASEKKIVVRISDTGVGIPAKDLPYVFDKFYRVERNSAMAKGTGLGLALVKQVVETVHYGRVSVDSKEGVGSSFSVELDLC